MDGVGGGLGPVEGGIDVGRPGRQSRTRVHEDARRLLPTFIQRQAVAGQRVLPLAKRCSLGRQITGRSRAGQGIVTDLPKRLMPGLGQVGAFVQAKQHSHANDNSKDRRRRPEGIHLVVEPLP